MSVIIIFLQKAIAQGMGMLYGALGEIVTEKSGNLNLGESFAVNHSPSGD